MGKILNRKQYLIVKKMDHQEMEAYLNAVYERGVREGERKAERNPVLPDMEGLEAVLQGINGIGRAKSRTIYEAVKDFLERRVAGTNEAGVEISGE